MRAAVLTAMIGVMLSTTSVAALAADPCLNPSDDMIFSCLKPGKTRGIRPGGSVAATAQPAPVAAIAPSAPAPHPVREALARPVPQPVMTRQTVSTPPAEQAAPSTGRADFSLTFAPGSAEATPEQRARLDGLGRSLASPQMADMSFRIEGHTDTTGSRDLNKTLSQQRAESIVAYLNGKFGLPAGKLQPIGVGEDDLPVQTGLNVAEPRNRIVRIVPIGS